MIKLIRRTCSPFQILFTIITLILFFSTLNAQNIGDFRTMKSGDWNSPMTWELFDGSTWQDSISVTPGPDNTVYIGNNHSVTLTQDESCNNLNLHTGDNQNRITTGSNILNVKGKLRAYTGSVPGVSTSALPITNYWINTSGGGKILISGNSRYITNTGEWGPESPGWRLEIALNTGETGVFNTGLRAAHIILTSGSVVFTGDNEFFPDSGVYGSGTLTIQSGATLRLKAGGLRRLLFPGPNAHFAQLDLNGTLSYDSTVVGNIGAVIINFNGTVAYSADGAQTFLTRGANSNGAHPNTYTNIELNGSGIKTLGLNTTVNGKLKLAGASSFSLGSYTLTYGGSSTLEYAGSIAQTTSDAELPATGAAPNLAINNSNGVTLHDTRTVAGQLTLSNGTISTGSYTLSIGNSGSVARTNGHVVGTLQKHIPTGSPVIRYEIGDVNNYTPVDLSFDAVTTAGQVTAGTVTGDHPEIATSMINGGRSVNRYWSVLNSGTDFSTCDAVFNFVSSDVDGGAIPGDFIVEKYDAPDWTSTNVGTRTSTSTEVTGLTSFSDFAVGEIISYTITATAGSNCSITPSGAVTVPHGGDQQFVITSDEGYYLDSLFVDGILVDSTTSYTFYDVTANHTIDARFRIITHTITATAGPNGFITPSGTVGVPYGEDQQFVISPDAGYYVDSLTVDGILVDSTTSYTFYNVTTNHTIDARFGRKTYTITATADPNGAITPSGLVKVQYSEDQQFVINPDAGFYLDSLIVDGILVDSTTSYTFDDVMANHTIDARFKKITYTITATSGSNGTITPSGPIGVQYGEDQQFVIIPDGGYFVDSLFVDGILVDSTTSYTFYDVTANHKIDVRFKITTYTLTATAGPNGNITPSGAVGVQYGEDQQFVIMPDEGFNLDSLIVDGILVDSTTSYTFYDVTANHTINVLFKITSYTITATAGPNGNITPSGVVGVPYGEDQQFVITPDGGYYVDSLIVDGILVDSTTSYTFYDVMANHTIDIKFALGSYTITSSAIGNGIITPSGLIGVDHGDNQVFIFTPNIGYHVTDLLVDGVHQDSTTSYTFYNIIQNHTITVYFGINTYTLTTNATNGIVTRNPDQQLYNYGTLVELTATPLTGFAFVEWTGDTAGTTNPITITMDANKNINANFTLNSYTITASTVGNGTITPSGVVSVNYGDNINFIITPDAGRHLDSLIVDDILTDSISSYTFVNITTNHTIKAVFEIDDNPIPTLTRIEPSSGYRGETINVLFIGSDFINGITNVNIGSGILLNSIVIKSEDSLVASITIQTTILPGDRNFSVSNIPPGGGTSGDLIFNVLNYMPAVFNLMTPVDGDTIQLTSPPTPTTFTWSRSIDLDADDTVWYALVIQEIMGDTVFITDDTTIAVNIQSMLSLGALYHWYVYATDGYDTVASADIFTFRSSSTIESADEGIDQIPTVYALYQNYPNPFNPTTIINYQIPTQSHVLVKIYNMLGQEMATLVDEVRTVGKYSITWNADGVPSGIYLYRIISNDFTETKRMMLIK